MEFRGAKLFAGVLGVTLAIGMPAAVAGKPRDPAKVPTMRGSGGAASTVDALATRAAIKTLRTGGNAVDAAVAAAGVLGVTEPFSSGIGGGGFMVIRTPGGKVKTIDGRETAPAAMEPDSFFESGAPLAFDDARYSGLSAGMPGTVATWDEALDRYGSRSLRRGAQAGHQRLRGAASSSTRPSSTRPRGTSLLRRRSHDRRDLPGPDGTPRDVGTRLRNRDMARAYERIARRGPAGFYGGPIADAMVAAAQDPPIAADADHVWRPGLMTERGPRRLRGALAASRPGSATAASTSGGWARRRAAARPWARRSTSSRATSRSAPTAPRPSTASSRPRAIRSPTAAPTSPTRPSSTSRWEACSPTRSRPSGARSSPIRRPMPARSSRAIRPTTKVLRGRPSVDTEGKSTTHLTVADRRGHGRLLHLHDRVDGRQRRSSSLAGASCSTTSSPTSTSRIPRVRTLPTGASGPAARWRRRSSRATASPCSRSGRRAGRRSSPPSCRSWSSASTSAGPCPRRSPPRGRRSGTGPRPAPSRRSSALPRRRSCKTFSATSSSAPPRTRPPRSVPRRGSSSSKRGRMLAAAEPTRRGGGSAMVVGGRAHGGR